MQSELIARWTDGKRVAFVGDGDAISVCIAYLHKRGIIDYGPSKIMVFDFDERICNAVTRFAEAERLDQLGAELYNCLDSFPHIGKFDFFYTNPPWGASNRGESVKIFLERGIEAVNCQGEGVVVIADNQNLAWPKEVLHEVQRFALERGFFVQKMMSELHAYHLDDAPQLRSCNLLLRAKPGNAAAVVSKPIAPERLKHFYGRDNVPIVKYVRERKKLDYGKAHEDEYMFEYLEVNDDRDS